MRCEELGEALSAYADGELAGVERSRLEQHLVVCEVCREQLAAYRQVTRRVQMLGDVQPTATLRGRVLGGAVQHRSAPLGLVPRLMATAAMVGLVAVVVAVLSGALDGRVLGRPLNGGQAGSAAVLSSSPSPVPQGGESVGQAGPPAPAEVMTVKLYFHKTSLDSALDACRAVYPVDRTIPKTQGVARATLDQLFAGPTPEEEAQGYASVFSSKTKSILKSVRIVDGTAYVDLVDIREIIPNASTSCGSAQFFSEVETTLKQFSTIQKVVYAIEGKPATFYWWMQIGCDDSSGLCDETPFRPVSEVRPGSSLTVDPSVGQPGATVTFQGAGFTPRGKVSVLMIEGLGLIIADVQADQDGRISGEFKVPQAGSVPELTFGPVAVFAIDEASRQRSPTATLSIIQAK